MYGNGAETRIKLMKAICIRSTVVEDFEKNANSWTDDEGIAQTVSKVGKRG